MSDSHDGAEGEKWLASAASDGTVCVYRVTVCRVTKDTSVIVGVTTAPILTSLLSLSYVTYKKHRTSCLCNDMASRCVMAQTWSLVLSHLFDCELLMGLGVLQAGSQDVALLPPELVFPTHFLKL